MIPRWAHYREAESTEVSCGTCDFNEHGRCEMFESTKIERKMVCDRFAGHVEKGTA